MKTKTKIYTAGAKSDFVQIRAESKEHALAWFKKFNPSIALKDIKEQKHFRML